MGSFWGAWYNVNRGFIINTNPSIGYYIHVFGVIGGARMCCVSADQGGFLFPFQQGFRTRPADNNNRLHNFLPQKCELSFEK